MAVKGYSTFRQNSSITGTLPSDCLVSYCRHSLWGGGLTSMQRCSWCILGMERSGYTSFVFLLFLLYGLLKQVNQLDSKFVFFPLIVIMVMIWQSVFLKDVWYRLSNYTNSFCQHNAVCFTATLKMNFIKFYEVPKKYELDIRNIYFSGIRIPWKIFGVMFTPD